MDKIGRYDVKRELGRGGMATVYEAADPQFGRSVAIKMLPPEFLHDPTFRQRFKRESQTIANLEHSAIVPVYDAGEEHGRPYLVMRLMEGGDLRARMRDHALPISEILPVLDRIGGALDRAHKMGIVHRDLKPDNILFDADGLAYLTDFGIVKLAESTSTFTGTTGVIGTPTYMSPEQAKADKELDGRSDIYSLGIIVYEALTGQAPYKAETPIQVLMKHVLDPVPDILSVKPDTPKPIATVLMKALAKEPEDRYPTASGFASALKKAGRPAESRPPRAHVQPPRSFSVPPRAINVAPPPHQPSTARRSVPIIAAFIGGIIVTFLSCCLILYLIGLASS